MKTKLFILPLILLLLTQVVLGVDFYITKTDVKKDIFLSESAVFNITIKNFHDTTDIFTFSTQDPSWILLTQQVEVPSNEEKSFLFKIDPAASVPLGVHAINIKIKSLRTEEFIQDIFVINIRPYDPVFGEYRPSIQFSVSTDEKFDPRDKIPVEIYLRNRNSLDVGSLKLKIDGELFSDTKVINLGPLEEKRTEYLFEIDPLQEPGLYTLDVQLQSQNITLNQATQTYEVVGYSSISMDSSETSFLFRNKELIRLENLGNTEKTKTVNLEMSWMKRVFTNTEPKAEVIKKAGKTSLQWEISIPSQEYAEITVTTNYRLPIIIVIAIIVIIILYFLLRSPVLITKEAIVTGPSTEGAEHLKIRIFVKNRSRKTIEKTNVFDRVPGIAELIKKKVLGTLEPEKITKQEKKGTVIKWNLDTLEPFEERIITYEIKSKLKIIGNISLPSARANFMVKNKEKKIFSQRIVVSN